MRLFVTPRVHRLELVSRDAKIADLETQVVYWRTRAERLTDAALHRVGAIAEPTMVNRVIDKGPSLAASYIAAMNITEIERATPPQEP